MQRRREPFAARFSTSVSQRQENIHHHLTTAMASTELWHSSTASIYPTDVSLNSSFPISHLVMQPSTVHLQTASRRLINVSLHAARIALSRVVIILLVDLATPNTPLDEGNDAVLAVGAVKQRTIASPRRVARCEQGLLDLLLEIPVWRLSAVFSYQSAGVEAVGGGRCRVGKTHPYPAALRHSSYGPGVPSAFRTRRRPQYVGEGFTHRCTIVRDNSSSEQRDEGRDESESPHFGGLLA
jgi:hypothetical protein